MQSKNILITGGLGFIGYEICLHLLERQQKVTVLDNLSPQVHTKEEIAEKLETLNKFSGFTFIKGDVRNYEDCAKAITGQEILIHLAAETGTGQSMYEIAKYVDTNVMGTANLLDVIVKNTIRLQRIILSSSRSVYGEGKYHCEEHGVSYPATRKDEDMAKGLFDPLCEQCGKSLVSVATDEQSKINPVSVYATTKRQQEELVFYANSILAIPYTIFRYQNVYGPGQSLQNPYTGILSIFSTRINNDRGIEIFEDGDESRDFVFIKDVVAATMLPVFNESNTNSIINVGSGQAVSVMEVAETLMKCYNHSIELKVTGKYRVGDIRHNRADIKRLQELYSFTPQYNFEQGIQHFANWVKTQSLEVDNYERSIAELKEKGLYK